jgi:membrane protein YqaA with SNARE-associated domain
VVDSLLDWLARQPTPLVYAALTLLSAVENVFPPVPADVAVALGAFLAKRGEVNGPLLGTLCWLANCGSAAWTYLLGRRHGAAFFAGGWRRKLLPPEAMDALQKAYDRHGTLGIFVSRFLPGVRAAVRAVDRRRHVPRRPVVGHPRDAGTRQRGADRRRRAGVGVLPAVAAPAQARRGHVVDFADEEKTPWP